jgi:hypothetical protein
MPHLSPAILLDILITNKPDPVARYAPDYVSTQKDPAVYNSDARYNGVDLNCKTLKEHFDHNKDGWSNLIFTNYVDFYFFKDGVL